MKITKLFYHRSLPNTLICADGANRYWYQKTLELKPIDFSNLKPIFPVRAQLMPVPEYIYRFCGVAA